jgi:hypothetical protein
VAKDWEDKHGRDKIRYSPHLSGKGSRIIGPRRRPTHPALIAAIEEAKKGSARIALLQKQFLNWHKENHAMMTEDDYEKAFQCLQDAIYGKPETGTERKVLDGESDSTGIEESYPIPGRGSEKTGRPNQVVRGNNRQNSFKLEKIARQTERAYLVELSNGWEGWLPKSQCTISTDLSEVTIANWLVEKEGLLDYDNDGSDGSEGNADDDLPVF